MHLSKADEVDLPAEASYVFLLSVLSVQCLVKCPVRLSVHLSVHLFALSYFRVSYFRVTSLRASPSSFIREELTPRGLGLYFLVTL